MRETELRRISPRTLSVLTNLFLFAVVVCLGAACFLPAAAEASKLSDRVYYAGSSEQGVSLMFNVYWGEEELTGILGVLDEYGVKATFFLGGSWADDHVSLVREIAARGHELGTHGYFHRDHDKLSYAQNLEEIRTSAELIARISGASVSLFAPPSGAYGEATVDAADALGLKTVLWSKDTIDWRDKDAPLCFRRATEGAEGGDLILMHPMAHTLEALPDILSYYQAHGLHVIPVGENIAAEATHRSST